MAASYCLLFLWMASLVALSHSEHAIQVQVFPSTYIYSPAFHLELNDFIYQDETCQSVSDSSQSIECSRMTGTPKLMDCDLGPDDGLPSDTTESFYSLKLNRSIDQHDFTFIFNNSVNLTAFSLHYYCVADKQENTTSFSMNTVGNFLPCVDNHKQRVTLSCEILETERILMSISNDYNYSFQLYISEIQFFIDAPVIDGSSDDQELRIPCLVSTSDVPSTCDHWWVDYGSYDDIQESIILGVHDRPPECGNDNTSSVVVDEEYTDDGDGDSCQIVVTFEDDCSELIPTSGTVNVTGIAVGAVGGILIIFFVILLITISIIKYKVRVTSPDETSFEMKSNECYATTNAISSKAMEIRNEASTNTVVMEQNEAYSGTVVGTNDDVTYEEVDSPYEEPR